MKKSILLFLLAIATALLTGCSSSNYGADEAQAKEQGTLDKQANAAVGMPAITNFAEKRLLKQIFELRDQQITTITYIKDLNGHLHKLCDSVGYGIPYATQYDNPEHLVTTNGMAHWHALPQADPNGLFSPGSTAGTWVLCQNPHGKNAKPVYVEPNIIVSPFPLNTH